MARWVTPTSMPPISFLALRQSQRCARLPGFPTVWFRCSRGSRASITWTIRTLAHAPEWPGTSSATARRLCELVTLWLTTWRIFPPLARLTFSKVREPARLQTPTWACSRSQDWGTAARLACSMPRANAYLVCKTFSRPLGPIPATTLQPIPLRPTGSVSVRKQEAELQVRVRARGLWAVSKPMAPIPRALRRLTFSEPFRI